MQNLTLGSLKKEIEVYPNVFIKKHGIIEGGGHR